MTGGGITINNFVTPVKAICLHCKNQLTNFIIKLSIGSSVTTLATSSISTLKPHQHIYTVDKMDKISPFGITRSALPTTKKSNVQNFHAYLNTSAQCANVHTQPCLVHLSSLQANMDKPNILDQYKRSLVTVPTPVRSDILETKLQGYDKQQTVKLVNGFKFGFRLGFQRDTTTSSSAQNVKNHKSALQNREQVFLKLAKESIKNRIAGPFRQPPFQNLNCSPLGLVPKNVPRKFRLIHDLSYPKHFSVNAGIPQENSWVQYEGIGKVIDLVKSFGRQCLLAKCDIEDVFRIINIHPSDHHLLGLTWNIFYYFDRCLPWELAVHVRSLNHFLVPCNGLWRLGTKPLVCPIVSMTSFLWDPQSQINANYKT